MYVNNDYYHYHSYSTYYVSGTVIEYNYIFILSFCLILKIVPMT